MYSVDFKIDFNSITVELQDVEKRTLNGFKNVVRDTAEDISKEAKNNINRNSYKTGVLKRSVITSFNKQGQEATIQATAKHAPYVEYSTRAHTIRPKNKKVLAFNGGNKMVFVKKVNHPGTKAKPFMEPAFNKNVPVFIEKLEEVINGANK